ncbi:MAG: aldolase/citrate lyase family protein, partial [Bacteroidota bacterium]
VITIRETEELIRIIDLCGVVPLVRLTSNCPDQIKRVMDAGAAGIIVPMVKSIEDVKKAITSVRYPPNGERSIGLARAHKYGAAFDDYFSWQQTDSVVIIQVEHSDAVEVIDQIMAIEEVDAYFIGPNDLSGSLGIPRNIKHPKYLDAVEKIKKSAKKNGKYGGVHIVEPDLENFKKALEEGFSFIAYSLDIRVLDRGFRSIFDEQ